MESLLARMKNWNSITKVQCFKCTSQVIYYCSLRHGKLRKLTPLKATRQVMDTIISMMRSALEDQVKILHLVLFTHVFPFCYSSLVLVSHICLNLIRSK
jgi:hypothetical protein